MLEAVFWIWIGFCLCLAMLAVGAKIRDRRAWRRAQAIGARMRARDQKASLRLVRIAGEGPTVIVSNMRGRR